MDRHEVYENEEGTVVIERGEFIPSMCPEFDPNGGGTVYYEFFKLDLHAGTISPFSKKDVKEFYRTLRRRAERINLWTAMRENGWVKTKE